MNRLLICLVAGCCCLTLLASPLLAVPVEHETAVLYPAAGAQFQAPIVPHRTALEGPWERFAAPENVPERCAQACCWDPKSDLIYMYGGMFDTARQKISDLQCYDPTKDIWTSLEPMSTARGWIKGIYCRGRIYAMGGLAEMTGSLTSCEAYDIATGSWSPITRMPSPNCAYQAVVWRDSLIYIIGGYRGGEGTDTVRVYDPSADVWMEASRLPLRCDMGDACLIGNTIYLVGSYERNSGLIADKMLIGAINPDQPTEIEWSWGPDLPDLRFNGPTVALNGAVYWFGGFTGYNRGTETNKGYVYSLATGTFDTIPSYPNTVNRCCLAVARESNSEIYGFGGTFGEWSPYSSYHRLHTEPLNGIENPGTDRRALRGEPGMTATSPVTAGRSSTIRYSLPEAGRVRLSVYELSGKLVRVLCDADQNAGLHNVSWDGRDAGGRLASNSIFLLRLTAPGIDLTRKVVSQRL